VVAKSHDPVHVSVELRGPAAAALRQYLGADTSAARLEPVLRVSVVRKGPEVPMLARLEWKGDRAVLTPQAALTPGRSYLATFDGPKVGPSLSRVTCRYRVPVDSSSSHGAVAALYPADSQVPANLLKFYLVFSTPMAEGHLFEHLRLLDAAGHPISQAFREVELWSDGHRRATVWISPGRTKQSLGLSEALGPVLRPQQQYTFELTPGMTDATGHALSTGIRHPFRTGGFDRQQPRIAGWRIAAPRGGSPLPLTVNFGEPLDHFLAARVIGVEDEQGRPVAGAVKVAANGRTWAFRPRSAWRAGHYTLVAGGELEDLAGNSLLRPFEAVSGTAPRPQAQPPQYRRSFRVQ
jgi:methionine-rich copper-binding protein CopC